VSVAPVSLLNVSRSCRCTSNTCLEERVESSLWKRLSGLVVPKDEVCVMAAKIAVAGDTDQVLSGISANTSRQRQKFAILDINPRFINMLRKHGDV
jgi:hypothetical protein